MCEDSARSWMRALHYCGEAFGDNFHGSARGVGGVDCELPAGEAGLFFGDLGEAELGVVIDDELIAVGGLVDACEGANAGGASVLEDFAQHHMLDHAAEDAAAHQPGIDVPDAGGSGSADYDADHAVVTKGVGEEMGRGSG